MFDPVTISAVLGTATAAFNNLKKGFAAAKDLESMGSDLNRWMKASSDIDNAIKATKNPPFYRKFLSGDSVEQAAMQAFTGKKQLEQQRYDLEQFVKFRYGTKSWGDLLALEASIRKERTEKIYQRQRLKQQIIEGFFIFLLICTVFGFIFFVWWLKQKQDAS